MVMGSLFYDGEDPGAIWAQQEEEARLERERQAALGPTGPAIFGPGAQPFQNYLPPEPPAPSPGPLNPNVGGFRDPVYNPANITPGDVNAPNPDLGIITPFHPINEAIQPYVGPAADLFGRAGAMAFETQNLLGALGTPGGQGYDPGTAGGVGEFIGRGLIPQSVEEGILNASFGGGVTGFDDVIRGAGALRGLTDNVVRGAFPEPNPFGANYGAGPPMNPLGGENAFGPGSRGASPDDAAILAAQREAALNNPYPWGPATPDVAPALPGSWPPSLGGTMGEVFPDVTTQWVPTPNGGWREVPVDPNSPAARMGPPEAYNPQWNPPQAVQEADAAMRAAGAAPPANLPSETEEMYAWGRAQGYNEEALDTALRERGVSEEEINAVRRATRDVAQGEGVLPDRYRPPEITLPPPVVDEPDVYDTLRQVDAWREGQRSAGEDVITLYHATSGANADSIMQQGLRPHSFLSTDPQQALGRATDTGAENPRIVQVTVPRSELRNTANPNVFQTRGVLQAQEFANAPTGGSTPIFRGGDYPGQWWSTSREFAESFGPVTQSALPGDMNLLDIASPSGRADLFSALDELGYNAKGVVDNLDANGLTFQTTFFPGVEDALRARGYDGIAHPRDMIDPATGAAVRQGSDRPVYQVFDESRLTGGAVTPSAPLMDVTAPPASAGGGGQPPIPPSTVTAAAPAPQPQGGGTTTTTTGIPTAPVIQQQAQQTAAQMGVPNQLADRVTQNWLDNALITQDYIGNPNVIARTVGSLEGAITGNYSDSFIAGLVQRQSELTQALERAGVSAADVKTRVAAATDARLIEHYQNDAAKIAAAKQTLAEADAKAAELAKDFRGLNTFWERTKNTLFPLDFGFGGQNILTGMRQGGIPTLTGMANRVALALHMPFATNLEATTGLPRLLAASNDGLNLGRSASGLDPSAGTLLRYIPGIKAVDKHAITPLINGLTDAQYKGLGGFLKMMNHEGNLTILAATGKDIADPAVRREAARMTNNAWSSAATATTPGRAQLERLAFTSPAFTRSQVGVITDMAKLIAPGASETQRILAAGAVLSNAVMILGVYKLLNDQFGIGDGELDPTKPGFGNIILPTTNSQGKHQVVNMFPQRSFQTAITRAVDAVKNKDEAALGEAFARLGAGRSGWIPSTVARGALGAGYDTQGKFYTSGMPLEERLRASAPIPVSAQNLVFGGGTDPLTLAFEGAGVPNYPESTGSQLYRESQTVNAIRAGLTSDSGVLSAAFPNNPELAQAIRGAGWEALTTEERKALIDADRSLNPAHAKALDALEATRKQYGEEKPTAIGNAIRIQEETEQNISGIRKEYGVEFDKIGEKLINGDGDPRQLRQTFSALRESQNQEIAVERWKGGTTYAGLPEVEGKGSGRLPNEVQEAISAYYGIGNDIPRTKDGPNYDAIQAARDAFITDLYRSSPDTANRLDFYLSQRAAEAESQKSEFLQYWDSMIIPALNRYYDVAEGGRTAYRREHPMDDALLTFAGYMPSTVSPLGGELLRALAPGRGVK